MDGRTLSKAAVAASASMSTPAKKEADVKAFTIKKVPYILKAENCAEITSFDIPFAVKEYIQNIIGQVLKGKQCMEWDAWTKQDLRQRDAKDRLREKAWIAQWFPGLLTGPHGAAIAKKDAWVPAYILSATIPEQDLKGEHSRSPLKACAVLWHHLSENATAFSFFNNHLDDDNSVENFENFVVDGQSTSAYDDFAIGEKGKGFVLATQFLFEKTKATGDCNVRSLGKAPGVSFRVGDCIGEVDWKKPPKRYPRRTRKVQILMDDLEPLYVDDWLENYYEEHEDKPQLTSDRRRAEKTLNNLYDKRVAYRLSTIKAAASLNADTNGTSRPSHSHGTASKIHDPDHEKVLAADDEVAITILGLPGLLQPEYVFSGIFNICPPQKRWRVPGTDFIFFMPDEASNMSSIFFNRDQIIPFGPAMNSIGINYHKELDLSSDRRNICLSGFLYKRFLGTLSDAVDAAFRMENMDELTVELALDILTADTGCIRQVLNPTSNSEHARKGYYNAFQEAFKRLAKKRAEENKLEYKEDAIFYPVSGLNSGDKPLILELGFTPFITSEWVVTLLRQSNAYTDINIFAETVLLNADSIQNCQRFRSADLEGLKKRYDRLRNGIFAMFSSIVPGASDVIKIDIKDHSKSFPKAVWEPQSKTFIMALPDKCSIHGEDQKCLCHIGSYLSEAMKSFKRKESNERYKLDSLTQAVKFRAQVKCMQGVGQDLLEPAPKRASHQSSYAKPKEPANVPTKTAAAPAKVGPEVSDDRMPDVNDHAGSDSSGDRMEIDSDSDSSSGNMAPPATPARPTPSQAGARRIRKLASSSQKAPATPAQDSQAPTSAKSRQSQPSQPSAYKASSSTTNSPSLNSRSTPAPSTRPSAQPEEAATTAAQHPFSHRMAATFDAWVQEACKLETECNKLRLQVEELTKASNISQQEIVAFEQKYFLLEEELRESREREQFALVHKHRKQKELDNAKEELDKAKEEIEELKEKMDILEQMQALATRLNTPREKKRQRQE